MELWIGIASAVIGSMVTAFATLLALPKLRAESRKANAEAGQIEWQTLRDEINRLQERVEAQDRRIAELEKLDDERADREVELEKENKALRAEVGRLERRVEGLEAILKVGPLPPDMQAKLAELDRKTGSGSVG